MSVGAIYIYESRATAYGHLTVNITRSSGISFLISPCTTNQDSRHISTGSDAKFVNIIAAAHDCVLSMQYREFNSPLNVSKTTFCWGVWCGLSCANFLRVARHLAWSLRALPEIRLQ